MESINKARTPSTRKIDSYPSLMGSENQSLDRVRQLEKYRLWFAADMFGQELKSQDSFDSFSDYSVYLKERIAELFSSGFGVGADFSESIGEVISQSEARCAEYRESMSWGAAQINHVNVVNGVYRAMLAIDHVGVEGFEEINEEFGIIDPRKYRPEDLGKLKTLLSDGEEKREFIDKLNHGDVTVVFSDTLNDYNGALKNDFSVFSDSSRSLGFEVSRPDDLHRIMMKLRGLGIKPSRIVISAHGTRCGIDFGKSDPSRKVDRTLNHGSLNSRGTDQHSVIVEELKDARLDALVAGCMQSSKTSGMYSIVLGSCEGDAEVFRNGYMLPTVASSILESIGRKDVEIFASKDAMHHKRDPYTGEVAFFRMGDYRPSMVRLTLRSYEGKGDSQGEIILRREKTDHVFKTSEVIDEG